MDKKPFLFGLGVGIMIGAALLQLMLVGEKQAAELHNYEHSSDGEKLYSQSELDQQLESERGKLRAELDKQTAAQQKEKDNKPADAGEKKESGEPAKPKDGQIEQTETSPGEAKTTSDNTANGADKAEDADKRMIVRILPNTNLTDTAELLSKNNIITDKKAFIDLMRNAKVRAGYFAFQGAPSLQQVKKIITSQPLPPKEAEAELNKKAAE